MNLAKARILLVEDSEELLKVWMALFKTSSDYTVKAVTRGATAIEMVQSGFEPDLLITDYYLGDCTGVDLLSRLRQDVPQVKTIVITGNHEDEGLKAMARSGDIDLLIKPVRFAQLKETIVKRLNLDTPAVVGVTAGGGVHAKSPSPGF